MLLHTPTVHVCCEIFKLVASKSHYVCQNKTKTVMHNDYKARKSSKGLLRPSVDPMQKGVTLF